VVSAGGQTIPVKTIGFRRRVLYAPLARRDLRIGNYLYLVLARPLEEGQTVEVKNPSAKLWPSKIRFTDANTRLRFSPAIHVNQVGYVPQFSKQAMVGYFLGSLGEMDVPAAGGFNLIDAHSGATVHHGPLTSRRDVGYDSKPPYQKVLEADC